MGTLTHASEHEDLIAAESDPEREPWWQGLTDEERRAHRERTFRYCSMQVIRELIVAEHHEFYLKRKYSRHDKSMVGWFPRWREAVEYAIVAWGDKKCDPARERELFSEKGLNSGKGLKTAVFAQAQIRLDPKTTEEFVRDCLNKAKFYVNPRDWIREDEEMLEAGITPPPRPTVELFGRERWVALFLSLNLDVPGEVDCTLIHQSCEYCRETRVVPGWKAFGGYRRGWGRDIELRPQFRNKFTCDSCAKRFRAIENERQRAFEETRHDSDYQKLSDWYKLDEIERLNDAIFFEYTVKIYDDDIHDETRRYNFYDDLRREVEKLERKIQCTPHERKKVKFLESLDAYRSLTEKPERVWREMINDKQLCEICGVRRRDARSRVRLIVEHDIHHVGELVEETDEVVEFSSCRHCYRMAWKNKNPLDPFREALEGNTLVAWMLEYHGLVIINATRRGEVHAGHPFNKSLYYTKTRVYRLLEDRGYSRRERRNFVKSLGKPDHRLLRPGDDPVFFYLKTRVHEVLPEFDEIVQCGRVDDCYSVTQIKKIFHIGRSGGSAKTTEKLVKFLGEPDKIRGKYQYYLKERVHHAFRDSRRSKFIPEK